MSGNAWEFLERVEGVSCPRCQEDLFPIASQATPEGFAFGCSEGHILPIQDLLALQSEGLRRGLRNLVASWDDAVFQLAEASGVAARAGRNDIAERLQRRIENLEARRQILRDALLKAAPAVPSSRQLSGQK